MQQNIDAPTHRHINPSTHQPIDASTHRRHPPTRQRITHQRIDAEALQTRRIALMLYHTNTLLAELYADLNEPSITTPPNDFINESPHMECAGPF